MKKTIAFVILACASAWAAIASTPARSIPTEVALQERNKAVARRVFEEIFNQGKFQVADEIYAQDFVNHGLHRDASLQEDQAAVRWEKQACPDVKMTIGPMVAEGDLVSVLWVFRGTNSGAAGWLPATGVKFEVRGITIWRIVDGRIREEWTSFDEMRILSELAYQLRWQLIGLLCSMVILFWAAGRVIRNLRRIHSPAKA